MSERNLYEVTGDIKDINTLLVPREQLEAIVGEQEPVGNLLVKAGPSGHGTVFGGFVFHNGALPVGTHKLYAAPVAQQPQEIEVQCPVCNHKFYEWPNDKQPQAEAVPVVDRVYEAAKRLVDHADFQLGGVLSAKSKARDIPSNAASKVKARHLASLRDALAKTPQQAEAVPSDVADKGSCIHGVLMSNYCDQCAAIAPPPGIVSEKGGA